MKHWVSFTNIYIQVAYLLYVCRKKSEHVLQNLHVKPSVPFTTRMILIKYLSNRPRLHVIDHFQNVCHFANLFCLMIVKNIQFARSLFLFVCVVSVGSKCYPANVLINLDFCIKNVFTHKRVNPQLVNETHCHKI